MNPDGGDPRDAPIRDHRREIRTASRGGSAFVVGSAVGSLLNFAWLGVLSHSLPQSQVGALLEAVAVFTMLAATCELGSDTGLLRFAPIYLRERPSDLPALFRAAAAPALAASSAAGLAVFIGAPSLAHLVVHGSASGHAVTDFRILACALPAGTLTTLSLAGSRAWTARLAVFVGSAAVPVLRLGLLGVGAGFGLTSAIAGISWALPLWVGLALGAAGVWPRIRRATASGGRRRRNAALGGASGGVAGGVAGGAAGGASGGAAGGAAVAKSVRRELWSFSAVRTFGGIFQLLVLYLDVLLVGAFLGPRPAAAYAVASRYMAYGMFAMQAIGTAVAPQLARLSAGAGRRPDGLASYAEGADGANAGANAGRGAASAGDTDGHALTAVYCHATSWSILVCWPPMLSLAIFSPVYMSLFGHGYVAAAGALSIICAATLTNAATGPNGLLVLMAGRSGVNLAMQFGAAVVNVLLDLWLIPHHGPLGTGLGLGLAGAAIAWAATIAAVAVFASGVLWRTFRILPFSRAYVLSALAAGGSFGVVGLAYRVVLGSRWPALLLALVTGAALYGAALRRWKQALGLPLARR